MGNKQTLPQARLDPSRWPPTDSSNSHTGQGVVQKPEQKAESLVQAADLVETRNFFLTPANLFWKLCRHRFGQGRVRSGVHEFQLGNLQLGILQLGSEAMPRHFHLAHVHAEVYVPGKLRKCNAYNFQIIEGEDFSCSFNFNQCR